MNAGHFGNIDFQILQWKVRFIVYLIWEVKVSGTMQSEELLERLNLMNF